MATKRKKPLLVTDKDGKQLFVPAEAAGIHWMCLTWDGIPITHFGDDPTWYLRIEQVIEWHEKELRESHGRSGSQETLDAAREILRKFQAGEVADEPDANGQNGSD